MKRWLTVLWPILMFVPAAVHADAAAGKAQIIALEHRWLDAIRHHDRRALEMILADRFVDINASGRVRDRDEAIAHASAPADTTQTITQIKVRSYGDTAIATGINTVHSRTQGWTVDIAFTDVFVRGDHGWQAVSAQETLRKPDAG
ncbi:MAG TPA: nuclear transport factor 2 family protein [Rhodanobacteraceae bacterium]|nr:nuclear transport factor 2 family protein [Rhodanobacteraceae bacterium]